MNYKINGYVRVEGDMALGVAFYGESELTTNHYFTSVTQLL
jgi:hypothetical protein